MSERGSFVTEYVYCDQCVAVIKEVLVSRDKFLRGIAIPSWVDFGEDLPIIAGKIGGLSMNEEFVTMEFELGEKLNERLCHPVRIAVLADSGESSIFTFGSDNSEVEPDGHDEGVFATHPDDG